MCHTASPFQDGRVHSPPHQHAGRRSQCPTRAHARPTADQVTPCVERCTNCCILERRYMHCLFYRWANGAGLVRSTWLASLVTYRALRRHVCLLLLRRQGGKYKVLRCLASPTLFLAKSFSERNLRTKACSRIFQVMGAVLSRTRALRFPLTAKQGLNAIAASVYMGWLQ